MVTVEIGEIRTYADTESEELPQFGEYADVFISGISFEAAGEDLARLLWDRNGAEQGGFVSFEETWTRDDGTICGQLNVYSYSETTKVSLAAYVSWLVELLNISSVKEYEALFNQPATWVS